MRARLAILAVAVVVAACGALVVWLLWARDEAVPPSAAPAAKAAPLAPGAPAAIPAPATPSPAPVPEAPRVYARGRVMDGAGQPIGGASVTASLSGVRKRMADVLLDKTADAATTSGDGTFAVPLYVTGIEFDIAAEAPGYTRETKQVLAPAEGIDGIELHLQAAGRILGRVVTLDREPVAGAVVTASIFTEQKSRRHESEPTGAKGGFELYPLSDGEYSLYARLLTKIRHEQWPMGIELAASNAPLAVVALRVGEKKTGVELVVPWSRAKSIEGTVVDERGAPVPGAEVWAERPGGGGIVLGTAPEKTSGSCKFSLNVLDHYGAEELAAADVCCQCADHEPARIEKVALGTKDLKIVLLSLQRGAIEGYVRDAQSGRRILRARVFLDNVDCTWGEKRENNLLAQIEEPLGEIGWTGRYSIPNVPAGMTAVVAMAPGYGITRKDNIRVVAGQTTEEDILLPPAARVQFRVKYVGTLEGQKAQCEILCYPEGQVGEVQPFVPQMEQMAKGGEYDVMDKTDPVYEANLAPGAYDVIACLSTIHTETRKLVKVNAVSGQTLPVEIELGGGCSIDGRAAAPDWAARSYLVVMQGSSVSDVPSLTTRHIQLAMNQLAALSGDLYWMGLSNRNEYRYSIAGIPAGNYTLAVLAQAVDGGPLSVYESHSVSLSEGEGVSLDFAGE